MVGNDEVVCTLYEGNYHLGVAVLINSILRGGFRGLFWIGYRGELPAWLDGLSRDSNGLYVVGDALLGFELLDSAIHFAHFKPLFMKSLFDRGVATHRLWYFDPDITVRCTWSFYQRWIKFGACICQEYTMGTMPSTHPIRCEWVELAEKAGWGEPVNQLERYFNSGFLGVEAHNSEILDTWAAANDLARNAGVDQSKFQTDSRSNTFLFADQDALNIAAMYTKVPLTVIGPEGMGWVTGGFTMYHSVGSPKPWRKKFLRSALAGNPPSNGDKHFFLMADGPLHPYSSGKLRWLRISLNISSLFGRFNRRG